jgi:hypothetical protein
MKTIPVLLAALLLPSMVAAQAAESGDRAWYRSPRPSVMTGFIYEPKKPYTIQQWMENLGSKFDAGQWVRDFKEVGASHLVFYDKWIDGLVFHDTKTTGFKTKRDFLRDVAAACRRGGLPLVIYFNAISDGNPQFNQWALLDREGKPIVFADIWPTRYQTLHSPFRQICLEQVRELLGNYGPIDGLWHDIFQERFNTTSEWTAAAYRKMFGEPFEKATRLGEFQARTLAGYLDEIDAIRPERQQERCVFTANGSGGAFLGGGIWKELVGTRLQYLYEEGHGFRNNERVARMAWALPKHLDICFLLNSSWFTPLDDRPPRADYSDEQAIAATAVGICQGAGVNLALTPGHDGHFGEDLQRAKAVGAWFRRVEPWVTDARPAADVAIVHGPNANAATEALAGAGVFTRWMAFDQPLPSCRAIVVPAKSQVDGVLAGRLRDYVQNGGTLTACGPPAALADLCGVRVKGEVVFEKELRIASVKAGSTAELEGVTLPQAAVAVEAVTAEVLARFDNAAKSPAILRRGVGQGKVLLVTATAAEGDAALWRSLRPLAISEPAFLVNDEVAARFRFIFTEVGQARVLHVIDAAVPAKDYRPQTIQVSLASGQLGARRQATLAGSDKPLRLLDKGGRLDFSVEPDPVATVVFRGAKP